ncbi:glycerol-3-phosphate cytidylyltransferase [Priestia megaterium]
MKKIMTYGTYDLLHHGHINLLRRAKEMGNYLIVGLSTDEFNSQKQKKSYYSYEERKIMLESIKYVDKVIPENSWDQKMKDMSKFEIDTFVMGDDWEGKFDFLKEVCQVVYLPRTIGISSTKIKKELNLGRI